MSLAFLWGEEDPVPKEELKYKTPTISPFDFVNAIHYTKEELITDEWSEKQYNPFVVNKALSFGSDTIILANEMNSRPLLDKLLQFQFLINIVRPKKRYNKWIKAEKEAEALNLVKQYYGYSTEKAKSALRLLNASQLDIIKDRLNQGGIKEVE